MTLPPGPEGTKNSESNFGVPSAPNKHASAKPALTMSKLPDTIFPIPTVDTKR